MLGRLFILRSLCPREEIRETQESKLCSQAKALCDLHDYFQALIGLASSPLPKPNHTIPYHRLQDPYCNEGPLSSDPTCRLMRPCPAQPSLAPVLGASGYWPRHLTSRASCPNVSIQKDHWTTKCAYVSGCYPEGTAPTKVAVTKTPSGAFAV